jgi:hypothetical protein
LHLYQHVQGIPHYFVSLSGEQLGGRLISVETPLKDGNPGPLWRPGNILPRTLLNPVGEESADSPTSFLRTDKGSGERVGVGFRTPNLSVSHDLPFLGKNGLGIGLQIKEGLLPTGSHSCYVGSRLSCELYRADVVQVYNCFHIIWGGWAV